MAEKWADYLITAVRFNLAGTHIDAAQVRTDNGDTAGSTTEASRAQVVASIESGRTFCTATQTADGKLHKGASVKIVLIDCQKFITTIADGRKADNLDYLPSF